MANSSADALPVDSRIRTVLRFAIISPYLDWAPWQCHAAELLCVSGYGHLAAKIWLVDRQSSAAHLSEASGESDAESRLRTKAIQCSGACKELNCWQLDPESILAIQAMNLDVLLLFGLERILGEAFETIKYGVWSFPGFGGRSQRYPGVVARPVVEGRALSTVALVKLAAEAGEDVVLKRATLRTQNTAHDNYTMMTSIIAEFPRAVAATLFTGRTQRCEGFAAGDWHDAVRALPRNGWLAAPTRAARWLRGKALSVFSFEQWHIGVAHGKPSDFVHKGLPEMISWAPMPRFGLFYADPIGLERGENLDILFECYDYWRGKGDIRSLTYSPGAGWTRDAERVLEQPFHLSYPTVINLEDERVCIPECCEAGVAYAYPISIGGKVKSENRRIFLDFEVADPTFVKHEGLWYLFGATAKEAQYALRIWFAVSLTGPWTPHPANPVTCDVRTARPAGPMFRLDGRLYRPSQNSSKSYGSSVNIMEIVELSPVGFSEVCIRNIEPAAHWPYPDGIHTLSVTRDALVIDAKRVRFSPFAPMVRFVNFVRIRLRRGRLARRKAVVCSEKCGGKTEHARSPS